MRPATLTIVVVVVVAGVTGSLLLASSADPSIFGGGNSPSSRLAWQTAFNGCCFDDGVRNAATINAPTIHSGSAVLYLEGTLSIASWTHWNGTGNDTGICNPPEGPAGVCDAYVGVWTPSAWNAFVAGGPMDPAWCYTGNASSCAAVNNATFTSTSLTSLEGQPFDIVIWNTQFYGLLGGYSFALYVSPGFSLS